MITIVSGLPRSGTSLMMQMLAAGGLPVLTDGRRSADTDNLAAITSGRQSKACRKSRNALRRLKAGP
jgi:hypothetical protein